MSKINTAFITAVSFILFFVFAFNLHAGTHQHRKKVSIHQSSQQNLAKKSEKSLLKKARDLNEEGRYQDAKEYYDELLRRDSTNVKYNFEQGMVYYFSEVNKEKSLSYFERAQANLKDDKIVDLYYYLAKGYHLHNRFDEAIDSYKKYLNYLKLGETEVVDRDEEEEEEVRKDPTADIEHAIQTCENAKKLITEPIKEITFNGRKFDVKINNLGSVINSEWGDYSSIGTNNDSTLIFTSKRKGTTGGGRDWLDGKYYEDIYISHKTSKGWSMPVSISPNINTKGHDASNSITKDGKKLYLYRDNENGNIFTSELVNGEWTEAKHLDKTINSKSIETSSGVGFTDDIIYIVSDRRGGFGGKDIYRAVADKNGVFKVINLGEEINTPFDEEAPFLTADENTIYFASKGHNSMGGYDIFKSVQVDGKWTTPVNLGYPINTAADDIFYSFEKDETHAYFSSNRIGDGVGGLDIYSINYDCINIPLAEIRGSIMANNKPVKARVSFVEKGSDQKSAAFEAVSENGKYVIGLTPQHTYELTVHAQGFKPQVLTVELPKQCDDYQLYQEIALEPVLDTAKQIVAQRAYVKNAFFDIAKETNSLTASADERYVAYSAFLKTIGDSKNRLNYTELVDTFKYSADEILALNDKGRKPDSGINSDLVFPNPDKATKPDAPIESDEVAVADVKFENILFDYNSTSINSKGKDELNRVLAFMNQNKAVTVELAGHTDSKGTTIYNLRLSKRRTDSAMGYLVQKGVERRRIATRQYGKSKPYTPNENPDGSDNPKGREQNRRVEVKIVPLSE